MVSVILFLEGIEKTVMTICVTYVQWCYGRIIYCTAEKALEMLKAGSVFTSLQSYSDPISTIHKIDSL